MRKVYPILTAAFFLILTAIPAAAQTKLVDTFKDWAIYEHSSANSRICFALSKPKSSSAKRDAVYIYVSAWPNEGVKAEISVKMGYQIKPDSVARIRIGSASYRMLVEKDKAFIDDPTAELKLIEAMKSGSKMIVESRNASGRLIKDTYSLYGITKALRTLLQTCS